MSTSSYYENMDQTKLDDFTDEAMENLVYHGEEALAAYLDCHTTKALAVVCEWFGEFDQDHPDFTGMDRAGFLKYLYEHFCCINSAIDYRPF